MLGNQAQFNNPLNWAFIMAAPPPLPGGAGAGRGAGGGTGAGAGGGGVPAAPPPPPPGGGPGGLGGPNLLAQMVQAMQLAAAALPPPGPGALHPHQELRYPLQFLKDYQEKDLKLT